MGQAIVRRQPLENALLIGDVAAAGVVVDHRAHRQRVGDQRQVDHGLHFGIRVAVGGGAVIGGDRALGSVELGLVGDVAHDARLRSRTEQGPLRTFQDFDALHVGGIHIEIAARQCRRLIVEIHRHIGELTDGSITLGAAGARAQAAHVDVALAGSDGAGGHVGQVFDEIVEGRHVQLGQRFRRERLDCDGHVLDVFRAALGRDGDLGDRIGTLPGRICRQGRRTIDTEDGANRIRQLMVRLQCSLPKIIRDARPA